MNKFTLSAIFASAVLITSSCNKQYNVDPIGQGTNGTGNGNSNFNWTGTAPFSANVNGVAFATNASSVNVTVFAGYYYISVSDAAGNMASVDVPINAAEGSQYSIPSPANVGYQYANNGASVGGYQGKCKIITNNATTIEGYFWADTKDYTNGQQHNATPVSYTNGYFKVTKP